MCSEEIAKTNKKSLKEEIYNFFDNPTRVNFRKLIKSNTGEFDILDFKENFPEYAKLARSILAISNRESGCLSIGIREEDDGSLSPIGLKKLTDKANILKGIQKYVPEKLINNIEILDFKFEDSEYKKLIGKKFQIIFVTQKPEDIPYISTSGKGKDIKANTIYFRHGTESRPANYEELQKIINKRVETKYSSSREMNLKVHLEQLKQLYEEIPKSIVSSSSPFTVGKLAEKIMRITYEPNPNYPSESYEDFILKMLERKKKLIAGELGVEFD